MALRRKDNFLKKMIQIFDIDVLFSEIYIMILIGQNTPYQGDLQSSRDGIFFFRLIGVGIIVTSQRLGDI